MMVSSTFLARYGVGDGEKPRYGVVEDGVWKRPYKVGANLRVRNLADGRRYDFR